jgi:hypothetical protein
MLKNGFQIKETSFEKISLILKSLASLSIEARDAQFIIQKNGEVYLIDPDFFVLTDLDAATKFAAKSEAAFFNQFKRLQRIEKNIH